MIKIVLTATLAALMMVSPGFCAGEGTAVGVKPDALSRAAAGDRILTVGTDVSVGEQIVTGPSGNVQLLFDDQTRIVVGPGSTLKIEQYLLNGGGADKFAVNALAGTFRFITGNSPKSVYSISTPTASIAVRGTKFDIVVRDRFTLTMLYEGALRLCYGPNCVDLTQRCDIGDNVSGAPQSHGWATSGRPSFVQAFGLANIQAAFAEEFRIAGAQTCLAPPSGAASTTIVDGGSTDTSTSGGGTQQCLPPFTGPNC